MGNYELSVDEVVLLEGTVESNVAKGSLLLTLTSQKMIFEKEKGLIRKERELITTIFHEEVKFYHDTAQIKQSGNVVEIQTVTMNIMITFSGMLEARKFAGKIMNAVTGTTLAKRSSNKIKDAFDVVDDTLGLDTRGTIKGLLENGVKGTVINGIRKKK